MKRSAITRRPLLAASSILLILGGATCAPQAPPPPHLLRIVATDSGFVLPSQVPAGITQVRLVNHGSTIHEGVLVHFIGAGSAATMVDSVRVGRDLPTNEEDIGGPGAALPGDSTSVWLPLEEGHFAVLCFYKNHLLEGGASDFEVVANVSQAKPPAADIEIRLANFSYDVHGPWTAGAHVAHVFNVGPEPHEFDPYRLADGKTPEDFFTWKEHGRKGEAPASPLGGSGSMVKGRQVWLPMTLTPGRYFMFCEVPAASDGKPHYRHGMYQQFEVAGTKP